MRVLPLALAFALAACGHTPQEVLERGDATEISVKRSPAAAAECIARNAEEISPSVQPRIRPLVQGEGREVVVQSSAESAGTLAVVQLRPIAGGSSARIHVSPQMLGTERFRGRLVDGC